jgi:hypothetical protein
MRLLVERCIVPEPYEGLAGRQDYPANKTFDVGPTSNGDLIEVFAGVFRAIEPNDRRHCQQDYRDQHKRCDKGSGRFP